MAAVLLKPGKERSLARRHPWVYASAVADVSGAPASGALVAVRDSQRRFLAWAAYSPASMIRARCWSFDEHDRIDSDWLVSRIEAAVARREELQQVTTAVRLVFGEADGLPGLVVDRYGDFLVTQLHAAGIDAHRQVLLDALCRSTACENVFDRSDPALRAREHLAQVGGVLRGAAPPKHLCISEHDARYWVDLRHGHKTGFYIDQRDNRRLVGNLVPQLRARQARAPRVLNCFCYTGGFAIAAALAGAQAVTSVDSSADAVELARSNATLNALEPPAGRAAASAPGALSAVQFDWLCADVFEQLRMLRTEGRRFELIVLDPPKFATNQHQVERAARAYKDINLGALRLLERGGMLMTFSCSGAVNADLFQKIVAGAAVDAGTDCFVRARLGAGADHPTLLTHPEGEYLKGLLLERT
ncbi:MAG TPA: class I SAM-dependent rRNA methyltransferase [Burkholderiaceae bacterium]|nr:class I SAM-dependent rRNA methyltransferase [Burkholderiaceae bacterium]